MSAKKYLIVNADDCNLTDGVTRAILHSHDSGIVTSTTFLINLPTRDSWVKEIKARGKLGVGLHLNITFGRPVSKPSEVRSLLDTEGKFLRPRQYESKKPKPREIEREYSAQIERFSKVFRRKPTHLDTHHQLHDHLLFFKVLAGIAGRHHLPIRRSSLMKPSRDLAMRAVKSPDYMYGSLDPSEYWTKQTLAEALANLRAGVSEIVCHPGENDAALKAVSSFTVGRRKEEALFSAAEVKKLIKRYGILLTHFGLCYNKA
ncbi:YdjC-like protein [sediment metagenome]|uniref:YdjC-like protein n=1 Tax=sediment metagenome TaxID=749907 RepID=D9PHR3_9ZZZZ